MSPEETERLLASAPTRRLSPEAERRVISSITRADVARQDRWWMRRVPLWQAAAACLVLCLATFGGARVLTRDRIDAPDAEERPAELVRVDTAVFGSPPQPGYRVDIAKWQFQPVKTE